MKNMSIPSDLRTLMTTRPGRVVAVRSVLQIEDEPNCARARLRPGMRLRVDRVTTDGVVVILPDGSDLNLDAECASYVQIEPVNGGRDARRGTAVAAPRGSPW